MAIAVASVCASRRAAGDAVVLMGHSAGAHLVVLLSASPMLLVCSTQRAHACDQARAFAGQAAALGGPAQVLPEDLSHLQINQTLGLPSTYSDAVDAFLRALRR